VVLKNSTAPLNLSYWTSITMHNNLFSKGHLYPVQYLLHIHKNQKHYEQKLCRGIVINIFYCAQRNDSEKLKKMSQLNTYWIKKYEQGTRFYFMPSKKRTREQLQ
jgi:hypothetical protein